MRKYNSVKKLKIFHGPTTIAGIGWNLAEWQRAHGCVSDCVVYRDNGFRQLFHKQILKGDESRFSSIKIRIAFFLRVFFNYDYFNFYGGVSLLPYGLDLPLLRLFNKKIIMVYCGSEARLICVEEQRNPYAYLLKITKNNPIYDARKVRMMKWHGLWANKVMAPRNLYDSVIKVIDGKKIDRKIWLHNVGFDTDMCDEAVIRTANAVPVIIHAPSEKGIKGTRFVNEAIDELRRRGIPFEYKELHGVSNKEVHKQIKLSDIVIDQFLLGAIGTFSFEGMGLGKPVVSYIVPDVVVRDMPDCPVYHANIDNLADRLQDLLVDRELREQLGRRGVAFVKKHLDKDKINIELLELYRSL